MLLQHINNYEKEYENFVSITITLFLFIFHVVKENVLLTMTTISVSYLFIFLFNFIARGLGASLLSPSLNSNPKN